MDIECPHCGAIIFLDENFEKMRNYRIRCIQFKNRIGILNEEMDLKDARTIVNNNPNLYYGCGGEIDIPIYP